MRQLLLVLALAASARAAAGQQPGRGAGSPSTGTSAADSIGAPPPPDCVQSAATPAAHPAPGDSLCLSRGQAIALALAANPQIQVAEAQTAQARARKVQATAIPDPDFGVSFEQSSGIFGAGGGAARVVGATLTIPFPDKFRLRGRVSGADVHSAEFQTALTRQTIASGTSQTYDSLLAALRRRRDLQEGKALAEDFLRKTEARFNAGTTARLDVIKARVDVAQAANDLLAADRDVANARAALNRLLGRPLGAPVAAADSLAVPPPLPDLARLEPAALGARPEIASVKSQQEGARAAISLAKEFWLPDIIFGVSRDYADPGPGVITTGIALPLPIFYWEHTKGEIGEARGRAAELDATYRDVRAQVGQDVRVAYATAETALRQAIYIRDELLPSVREAYRIASVAYGLGGASALEVLDARRSLLDAESQYTDALAAANGARADLERAIATPLATFDTGESHDR
jgi:cobalt-zinc-cadmium efflux system outer membrane protein